MVVITVGERERARALVRLAGRNKHTLAFWMAPRLQMAFRDISPDEESNRVTGGDSCPALPSTGFISATEYDSH